MFLPLILALSISPVDEPVLPEVGAPPPMILERLGEHRRPVATDSVQARQWFDQGRADEAARIDQAFRKAWRSADVMPPASCYCGEPVAK